MELLLGGPMQMKRFQWYFVGIFTLVWQIGGCSQADISSEVADFGTAKLEFLDVGQGLSVLIQSSGKEWAFLYDAGNDSTGFWDSLHVRNIKHLDWALVSHWHRDHAGGFLEWDGSVQINTLFYSRDTGGIWLRDSILKLAKRFGTKTVAVERGQKLPCEEWSCQILWPTGFKKIGGNDASAVLQISDGKERALFTGDLENLGEAELLELSHDLQASILQVGHHGSTSSSSLRFLEQVAPTLAVISVGKGNPYGHPAKSTLKKLSFATGDSSKILRTDLLGTLVVEWRLKKGLWLRNY